MDSGIQSTFIPKDAAHPTFGRRSGGGGLSDLLLVLAVVLFATSCALAVAVFLYQQYLSTQIASDSQQIQRAEAQFQPALMQEIVRLGDRIQSAQQILNAHIAPSAFFSALDQVTLQSISFTSLSLDASDPSNIQLTMDGVAQNVNAIALENDLLNQTDVFSNPIFSDIQQEQDGVHFEMTAQVSAAALNYVSLIDSAGSAASSTQSAGQPSSSDTQSASTSTSTPATQQTSQSSGQQVLQQAQQGASQ